jgi:hypothetical protein
VTGKRDVKVEDAIVIDLATLVHDGCSREGRSQAEPMRN